MKKNKSEIEKAHEFTAGIIAVVQDQYQLQAGQRLIQMFKEVYGKKHGFVKLVEQLNKQIIAKIATISLYPATVEMPKKEKAEMV